MQTIKQSDRLSWGDTVFCTSSAKACRSCGEHLPVRGEISLEDCVQFIESKLRSSRYLKRVVSGRSVWPSQLGIRCGVDLRRHVREVTLNHGTDAELKTFAGKLFGAVMDRHTRCGTSPWCAG